MRGDEALERGIRELRNGVLRVAFHFRKRFRNRFLDLDFQFHHGSLKLIVATHSKILSRG